MPLHAVSEEAKAILIVGLLLELETPAVDHVVVELVWHALAEVLEARLQLLILNILVLLILVAPGQALPRQTALDKIQYDMAYGFQIITSTLLLSFVRIQGCVASRASQILAITIWNMLAVRGLVVLGEPEVDNVERVLRMLLRTDQEVVWLDVSVDDPLLVALLDPLNHLKCHHATCLQIELVAARLKQILQTLSEQLHDHDVELIVGYRLVRPDVE